jgi:hypothetical protein
MATDDASAPTAREAREVLQQLGEDEDAVRYPPIPMWFFVVQAGAVAGILLAQLLGPSDAHQATVGVAVASIVLGSRYWLNRDGVSWVSVKLTDMAPFLAAVLGICAACWTFAATTGSRWVWIVGAIAAGAVVLHTGHRYRREFGHGI